MTLKRGLIVSCQARGDNPLRGPDFMAAMAAAAEQGGAIAIRADSPDDIRAIKSRVDLPVIGLWKLAIPGFEVYITPTLESAAAIAAAGADLIALDATARARPEGSTASFIRQVKRAVGLPIFADCSTLEEGVAAAAAGADYLSTTMAGYTPYTTRTPGPDLDLLGRLAAAVEIPVIAEGRFWTVEQVEEAFALGAHAVVIGTAITNPREITRRFHDAVPAGLV